MFTYEFWCSEVLVFQGIFKRTDLLDLVYVHALSGITHLAAKTIEALPERKDDLIAQFRECFALAQCAKGNTWVYDHMVVAASHGEVPPT